MARKENELNIVLVLIKKKKKRRGFSKEQPLSTFIVVLAAFRYHAVNVLNPLSIYLAQTLLWK